MKKNTIYIRYSNRYKGEKRLSGYPLSKDIALILYLIYGNKN
jgi:hypothetical protein